MKQRIRIFFLFTIAISQTFCAMKQELQSEFPQEIKSVYYQKVVGNSQDKAILFYIEFKKPLAPTIKLDKIYFHSQLATVNEIDKNTFEAYFKGINNNEDLILDINPAKEYGNKAPVIEKSKFDLKPNEAVLEYKKNKKTQFFKITNLIEKTIE